MSSSATAPICTGPTHHATAPNGGVEDGDDNKARSAESKTRLGGVEGALGGVEAHRRHRERDGGRTGLLLELYWCTHGGWSGGPWLRASKATSAV
ncbi:unnamed protein product [Miscanthus lutarioriparius]|uniref:Uncharacterized protein n=1 Tax=Miscanthus lutarioriparius TaxID=422564 RepID=A0A811QVG2_9POAL|nr:unnamed protein product [Miscanthus lutarioriparius]